MMKLFEIRKVLRTATLAKEDAVVRGLVERVALANNARRAISRTAVELIRSVRSSARIGKLGSFLAEYGLSTREGIALMCLAEAMLRVPDDYTIDELIRDKITPHNWSAHFGGSGSVLVKAPTWALMLTGRPLADRPGAILPFIIDKISPGSHCHERSVSIDTTATGGNVSLLTLQVS